MERKIPEGAGKLHGHRIATEEGSGVRVAIHVLLNCHLEQYVRGVIELEHLHQGVGDFVHLCVVQGVAQRGHQRLRWLCKQIHQGGILVFRQLVVDLSSP